MIRVAELQLCLEVAHSISQDANLQYERELGETVCQMNSLLKQT